MAGSFVAGQPHLGDVRHPPANHVPTGWCATHRRYSAHHTGDQPKETDVLMGDCFALPEQHHALLRYLTATKRRRKNGPIAKGDLDEWAEETGMDRESLRLAKEDLLEDRWLRPAPNGLLLNVLCTCANSAAIANSQDPAIAPVTPVVSQLEAQGTQPVGGLRSVAPPPYYAQGSALQMPSSEGVSSDSETEDEAQRQAAEALFTNGADDDPRPRRQTPARELVEFFLQRVPAAAKRQGIEIMPTAISAQALGGQIRRMLQGGMSPDDVRSMIILFGKQYGRYHKPGADPAKVFLAHRRRLYEKSQEQHRYEVGRDPKRFAKEAGRRGRRYSIPLEEVGA